ncbi:peptidase [Streptomyces badius]
MDTVSAAKDLDVIRRALDSRQLNYFGYSYGTYLGAVYAKLFPERVRRLVLDSVVDPDGVWYEGNLGQDYAFDDRHKAFAAWVAKNDAAYGLGTDPAAVEAAWYRMRADVARKPAGGTVGASELEDAFLPGGYYNGYWPYLAEAFAAYVKDRDAEALVEVYENFGAVDASGDNGYSVYTAVQCRDAGWPEHWSTWRNDSRRIHRKAPFMTWNNTWYNAPCANWPVPPLRPLPVNNRQLPPALILQATDDAATPYGGAVSMHRKLKGSSLVVEEGGGNHGITLSGNDCLDKHLTAYLTDGTVPRGRGEADAVCAALPEPKPLPAQKAAAQSVDNSKGSRLHGLLGFRP